MDMTKFRQARMANELTYEQAANIAKVSTCTYVNRERQPEYFRLMELKRLYEAMDEVGKRILRQAVDAFLYNES